MTDFAPGCRVLIVEDDYIIALDLADMLVEAGAVVMGPVGHMSGAETLLKSKSLLPDVVLLDLSLHGAPSYPLADILIDREIPFFFTTGFDGEAIDAAYRHYPRLEKPVTKPALLAALKWKS